MWTSKSKASLLMQCGLREGVAFVQSAGLAINRNGGGRWKFRGKFQSPTAEISKRQGAAFPCPAPDVGSH